MTGTWNPDPWPERSEEFYRMVYAGGKCRYCQKPIHTDLDICQCPRMVEARDRFKCKIGGAMIVAPVKPKVRDIDCNPNKHTEPDMAAIKDVPF